MTRRNHHPYRTCCSALLVACSMIASGVAVAEEGVSAQKASAHKGKKSKKQTNETEVVASSQVETTDASAPEFQASHLPAGLRQSRVRSIEGNLNVDSSLKAPAQENLLQAGTSSELASGKAVVTQTVPTDDAKKNIKHLNIGVFRSQDLAEGFVAAPGIADFAAYFRGTAAQKGAAETPRKSISLGALSSDDLKKQAEAETLRTQTVESIRQILLTRPSPEQRFDLLMRLSEIEIERHGYALELEIKTFNEAHDKWKATGKGIEPVFRTARADAHLLAGIEALRSVVNEFPNHPRTPEALFNLGFLLTQNQSDSAVLYFERLVSRFPKSEFVPDALLALGEFHFSKHNFDKALASYQKILNYKGTRAYNYAVYKIGWTWFNIRPSEEVAAKKNLNKSLAAFKLVVKLSEDSAGQKALVDLRKEALRDMVLVYADLGEVDAAQAYFESLREPELYLTLLERLAWQNSEAGNYPQAVAIYQRLLSEGALNARLPQFYSKIPELFEKQRQRDKLIGVLSMMSGSLSPESAWMKAHRGNAEAVANRNRILSKELRSWAEKFHMEAQKGKAEKSYDDALAVYGLYLTNFGTQAESYSSHFFNAEIMVRKGRYLEASDEYMKAAKLDEKFALKGKYTKDALLNAVGCVDRVLAKATLPKLPDAGKASEKIPLTALHERMVAALDTFNRMYPTDTQGLELGHRAASIVYAFGDYDSANRRWTALAKRFPKSNEVRDGARMVVKVSVERKDWDTAIVESRKFLAIPGVKEVALGKDLTQVLKGSIFSKALVLEQKDKRADASELFLAYHREFQDDADAPKALFNAANNRFKLGRIDEAISSLKVILAQYPKSELVPNAHYLIASSYDALGRFADSATSYEQLAHDSPANSVAPDALLRAAEQRSATGEYEAALRDTMDFLMKYGNHKNVGDAYVVAGKAHLKMNNVDTAVKTFVQGADQLAKSRADTAVMLYGLAAETAWKQSDKAKAFQICATGSQLWSNLPEKARTPAAQEGARLLGTTQVAILDAQLPTLYHKNISDGLQLVPQFTKIRDEATALSQKYVSIVKLGNAEAGVAALYRVAEIQEFLANTLIGAPVPTGAKPEEVESFKSNLEKIGLPLQDEAAKLYFAAWQKANETEALTPFMRKLHDKLVALKPAEFKKVVEEFPAPAYYSSDLVLNSETSKVVKN